ncbi:MAG: ribonucleoside-diphosphate reductase alpha chain, partial [Microbacteriaceae bacterium]|nr:ribonucleoside-diphosphate reductase alpha chain [Microbacteriaceae bacterium]
MAITVVKRNGQHEAYDANKINLAIEHASAGLDDNITWVTQIASELELTLFDGITTQQLDEAVIQVALQNVKDDPAFDTVAARLLLKTIYKRVLGDYSTASELKDLHRAHFSANITRGVEEQLLDSRLTQLFDLDLLASHLEPAHDELLKYIGVVTLNNRYGIKGRNGDALEVPQYFWMRIAMGLSLNEAKPNEAAIAFYEKMSRLEYLAAGSTLVNAGTIYPQLANCFVMEMQDDMEHIAKTTRDVMWLTKGTGGIGLSVTKLRSQGSPIRSNNTTSTGPIPFMHTIDS